MGRNENANVSTLLCHLFDWSDICDACLRYGRYDFLQYQSMVEGHVRRTETIDTTVGSVPNRSGSIATHYRLHQVTHSNIKVYIL